MSVAFKTAIDCSDVQSGRAAPPTSFSNVSYTVKKPPTPSSVRICRDECNLRSPTIVKTRMNRPFGEPGFCDDFVDGKHCVSSATKKGLRRGASAACVTRPLLLPDLGASCEVNLGHAAHIPATHIRSK